MTVILRAHVAAAAHDVVPLWPLSSFIAVNPLSGHESEPFENATASGWALTRQYDSYLSDLRHGRITEADLEAALLERIPELDADITIRGTSLTAVGVAVRDMRAGGWASTVPAPVALPWVDEYVAGWVSTYLNPDPLWVMPHKQRGFYRAWRTLARHDRALPRAVRHRLTDVPLDAEAALAWSLDRMGVIQNGIPDVLRHELTFLPGWVGHIKWRAENVGDIDLLSYLAVRCTVRVLQKIRLPLTPESTSAIDPAVTLWPRAEHVAQQIAGGGARRDDIAVVARVLVNHPLDVHPFTWQRAYELHYRDALLSGLSTANPSQAPSAIQVVMCIDPRSEGMRRQLEKTSAVETFGFAGFFGVPVRFARYNARGAINALPALLTPRHTMTELPAHSARAKRSVARMRAQDAWRHAQHVADTSTATPFAFAEATGWLYAAASILRTFAPTLHARLSALGEKSTRGFPSTVTVTDAFTIEERAAMAETAIRMMGMTHFAPLVVLAAHTSQSTNNLYESALDCGACGGNPGTANARAAAAIFNDPDVRELLTIRGIAIPAESFFVAAKHNTVSDSIVLEDRQLIPESHAETARLFDALQHRAGNHLIRERASDLPGASPTHSPSRVRRRAYDWAEVYPELGLAGNAALIIGPRRMTRGVDLARRVFLHSYETGLDPDGVALETIMTAPLIVAQWINHQYFFSALNPTTLGAGTKTVHNAVGTIGVLEGGGGDLRRGLPWQSVGIGSQLFHEPLRLTVLIEAPLKLVGDIVSRNQVLRNLLDNDWITLSARPDAAGSWHDYTRYSWKTSRISTKGQRP